MQTPPSITAFVPSRHPALRAAYNYFKRAYDPNYVNPNSWNLELTAHVAVPPGATSFDDVFTRYNGVQAVNWTVRQVVGTFVAKHSSNKSLHQTVLLPEPGEYETTLEVIWKADQPQTATSSYRFWDFLVVGIGDSFASGQGNPDIPAVNSADQQIFCKVTTAAMVLRKAKEHLRRWASEAASGSADVARAAADLLPFAGKLVIFGINRVEDVAGAVKSTIQILGNYAVDFLRLPVHALTESFEEAASLIGLGDGAEPAPHPAVWQEPRAYRSYRSAQSLAAWGAESDSVHGSSRITFLPFGRTGSEIDHGLLGPRTITDDNISIDKWIKDLGQIEEARETVAGRRIDVLMISIGINDLGFSTIVRKSILKAGGQDRANRIAGVKRFLREDFPKDLDALKLAVDSLNPKHVLITEYPVSIFDEIASGEARPCGVLASWVPSPGTLDGFDLTQTEAKGMVELGAILNETIRVKGTSFGWEVVGNIAERFHDHGYCTKDGYTSYFVASEESCLHQGDFEGMLHPNQKGHEVVRDLILPVLREFLPPPQRTWLEPVLGMMMVTK